MIRDKRILVAVLNWGLGHATRSIPIIEDLITQNNHISIASDGAALELLQSVFPHIPTLTLPGYDVTYPTSSMVWNIGTQFWKIKKAIAAENHAVSRWINSNPTDVIISDNRYGCHHESIHNILVSHQLNLQLPFAANLINKLHAKQLSAFSEIWVPDTEQRTYSGELSNPKWIDTQKQLKYIGPQSRLVKQSRKKKYDIAAILSGPEPQRSYLENELMDQLIDLDLKSVLVQGSRNAPPLSSRASVDVVSFADSEVLSELINSSELIICRSGYSTIMDLAHLGGNALFIPTPGQTEQIYLAENFERLDMAQYQSQRQMDVALAWKKKNDYSGF